MSSKKDYQFPIQRPHSGIPLSNGRQGLLIWGGGDTLKITVARAGFWDHRGGTPFRAAVTYAVLRDLLLSGREEELAEKFRSEKDGRSYARPCQIGAGRIEIVLRGKILRASLGLRDGGVSIIVQDPDGNERTLVFSQSRNHEAAWLELAGIEVENIAVRRTWEWIGERLAKDGVEPPDRAGEANCGAVRQRLPEDAAVAFGYRVSGDALEFATALGEQIAGSDWAERLWNSVPARGVDAAARTAWWGGFSASVPSLKIPDPVLQHAWDFGIYKMAGAHPPDAPAATLQSAWMEDHRLPPWSNDYHFNINLQMMYWPCLGANRLEHFAPLWKMIRGWMPQLRANGEAFFGVPGALMLPHAVDDRCQVVGSFWSGTVDHACTAWVAQIAWLHYRHSMDETFLRDLAWPLLAGAFEGYWAMAEEVDGKLALPVSVSPEYHARKPDGIKVWGRNASFQLAAFHMLAQILPRAAALLGHPVDSRWQRVGDELPEYSLIDGAVRGWGLHQETRPRIGLWDGLDLEESHRHHSHLASIYPFQTLAPRDPRHRQIVKDSVTHWLALGAGQWAGWSLPWTSILCSRCDLADAAVSWLHWWGSVFTDPNGATLHDADFAGCGTIHPGPFLDDPAPPREMETMQLDATFGAMQAILEILVQQRGDTLHILPAIPVRWRDFSFDGILVEGGFLVGATAKNSQVKEVRITSLHGGSLRLCTGSTLESPWIPEMALTLSKGEEKRLQVAAR